MNQPPSIGPIIGPITVPVPKIAIAVPWRSGGLMRNSVACDSGISPAPAMPWIARKITSWLRLVERPHSAEAVVNTAMQIRNTGLMPNRPASQPVSGIITAAQTMYEVSAQAIWSCEVDMLPWICGSDTLRIVLSSPCMMLASMIDSVSMPRCGTGVAAGAAVSCPLTGMLRRNRARGPSPSPRLASRALGTLSRNAGEGGPIA